MTVASGTAVEIIDIERTLHGVLDTICVGPYLRVSRPYAGPIDVVTFFMTLLTDGVFVARTYVYFFWRSYTHCAQVWRCYAVTKGFRGGRWLTMLWFIPFLVYVLMFGEDL